MGIEDAVVLAMEVEARADADAAIAAWFERRYEQASFVQRGQFETGQRLTLDEESDEPKFFPPPVREAMAREGAEIGKRLAEPI